LKHQLTEAGSAGEALSPHCPGGGMHACAWLGGSRGQVCLLLLSSWAGLGTSRQLSGPGGTKSGMPSLSSSSSHSSPIPSLSVSSWALLMMVGQLSVLSWWPSPSLWRKDHIQQGTEVSALRKESLFFLCKNTGLVFYQTLWGYFLQ
jgi:hypothetical protein